MIVVHRNVVRQFITHIKKIDRPIDKAVLEACLREQLELALELNLESVALDSQLISSLAPMGVHLQRVECRPIPSDRLCSCSPGLQIEFWEFWLDGLATNDGFLCSLDLVVGLQLSPEIVANQSHSIILNRALAAAARLWLALAFRGFGVEDVLSRKAEWSAMLLSSLQEGHFDKTLDELHSRQIGPGHSAGPVALWVTDVGVTAQPQAFRPSPLSRYGDPLANYYLFAANRALEDFKSRLSEDS